MNNKSGLIALAFGTLGLGMSEFGMMSILSAVAADLHISIPRAGHFIAAYALGVCAGAILLSLAARKQPLKKTLLALTILMAVGNFLAALSPNYAVMLVMRFVSGLPHGAFFGVAGIIAKKMADNSHQAAAISVMLAGMTVANLFGVPLGTAIAHTLSWRAMFILIAIWDIYTVYTVWRKVPVFAPLPDTGFMGQFVFLKKLAPWVLFAAIMFGNAGVFCWYSYINPLLVHVSGFSPADMTVLMIISGAGMVIGNLLSGELADRYNPVSVVMVIIAVMAVGLLAVVFYAPVPMISVVLMFVIMGCLFGATGPEQVLIIDNSKGGELLGASGAQVAFNLGNAFGASIGAIPIMMGYAYQYTAVPGVMLTIVGLMAMVWFGRLVKDNAKL